MNDLWVSDMRQHAALHMRVWCDDTSHIHTFWKLCELHNSERNLKGGRFRRYNAPLRSNCITIPLVKDRLTVFTDVLEWLANNVETGWSMSFTPSDPISPGGGIAPISMTADFHLYFEEPEDAVLCLLKFR